MRRVYFWRYPLYSVDVRYVSEALAKVSFSPSFSLGLQQGPILRNRFNGLRVSSQPSSLPKFHWHGSFAHRAQPLKRFLSNGRAP